MAMIPEIEGWKSIRSFTDEQINAESLDRILEAGRKAPSAKNRQPSSIDLAIFPGSLSATQT